MAHFAEVNKANNKVLRVIVISNERVNSLGGDLSVAAEEWVKNNIPQDSLIKKQFNNIYPETYWKQCSYNKNFRKQFPGVGSIYDSTRDAFYAEKFYASFIFDEETCLWNPPIDAPNTLPENQSFDFPIGKGKYATRWNEDRYQSSGNGWVSSKIDKDTDIVVSYYFDEITKQWVLIND